MRKGKIEIELEQYKKKCKALEDENSFLKEHLINIVKIIDQDKSAGII